MTKHYEKWLRAPDDELDFDVTVEEWLEYVEWCSTGYVKKVPGGNTYIETRPSLGDFYLWRDERADGK